MDTKARGESVTAAGSSSVNNARSSPRKHKIEAVGEIPDSHAQTIGVTAAPAPRRETVSSPISHSTVGSFMTQHLSNNPVSMC